MTHIFELNDLRQTTPATVTRCGMIYVDENFLDQNLIFKRWKAKFFENNFDEE